MSRFVRRRRGRLLGAPEALHFVRRPAFDPPVPAFDAAASSGE